MKILVEFLKNTQDPLPKLTTKFTCYFYRINLGKIEENFRVDWNELELFEIFKQRTFMSLKKALYY